jgi:hypothetical protein
MALEEGVNRIDWHVLEGNASAERFYAELGACNLHLTEHRAPLRLYRHRQRTRTRNSPRPRFRAALTHAPTNLL